MRQHAQRLVDALAREADEVAELALRDVQQAADSGVERIGWNSAARLRATRAYRVRHAVDLAREPSMGLAPQIVDEVFEIVRALNARERVTFLLAEQNTNMALRYSDCGYILENGRIVMDGDAATLRENRDVKEFYLGASGGERKSFRDVKSYKRRKRWLA